MITLTEAEECIEGEYNDFISVYNYGEFLRFTNGSAAHYADIRLSDGRFELTGERYGEPVNEECKATKDALLSTLSSTF